MAKASARYLCFVAVRLGRSEGPLPALQVDHGASGAAARTNDRDFAHSCVFDFVASPFGPRSGLAFGLTRACQGDAPGCGVRLSVSSRASHPARRSRSLCPARLVPSGDAR